VALIIISARFRALLLAAVTKACALNLKNDFDAAFLTRSLQDRPISTQEIMLYADFSQSPLISVPDGGVVGGSRAGPVVTPHTLELTARGRVLLQLAPPETARAYLPPEYRPGRVYSDTDSEKVRRIRARCSMTRH